MGVCASSHLTRRRGSRAPVNWSTTVKVIRVDGSLEEFDRPVKANHVLSVLNNSDTFLCNSETMYVDTHVPHVSGDDELQPGQIYFVMPSSKLQTPLSLLDLCALAFKASVALEKFDTSSFFDDSSVRFSAKAQHGDRCCRIPTGFEAVALKFPVASTNLRSN